MTVSLTRRPAGLARRGQSSFIALAVIATAIVLVFAVTALRLPGRVHGITITNPHAWDAVVSARHAGSSDVIPIGTVPAGTTSEFVDLLDLGGQWEFTFRYAGVEVNGAWSRADLRDAGWKITVPDEFADAADTEGVPHSATP
jgi:hypothetical protein